jgi:hypothetical protein
MDAEVYRTGSDCEADDKAKPKATIRSARIADDYRPFEQHSMIRLLFESIQNAVSRPWTDLLILRQ